jgi:hypothetical protein
MAISVVMRRSIVAHFFLIRLLLVGISLLLVLGQQDHIFVLPSVRIVR